MNIPEKNETIDLKSSLIDLATYRKDERVANNNPDPLIILIAYAQDELVYQQGQIIEVDPDKYQEYQQHNPNELVNKFGLAYLQGIPLLLHKRLADVLIDVAIDMRDRRGQFTVVMDALRTYDSALKLQESRPDLVELGLLAKAGNSAHNRALAVDSKLFELADKSDVRYITNTVPLSVLVEADERGHLDDLNMSANSRFYQGPMSNTSRHNRLTRLQAWQRASVKRGLPIANLLSEFWDDRVTGSPDDMWRVLACRALCIGINSDPKSNPVIQSLKSGLEALHLQNQQKTLSRQHFAENAHKLLIITWDQMLTKEYKLQLNSILGRGAGDAPPLSDFMFHEWLNYISDQDLINAGFPRQSRTDSIKVFVNKKDNDSLRGIFEAAQDMRARLKNKTQDNS